jgi:membrane-bound metal-dependent hydrolase YbcI (DUF457 family)
MATPVAHSLVGIGTYVAFSDKIRVRDWKTIVLYVAAANAADLDFLPGVFSGNISGFHQRESHSLGFSLLFALVFGLWAWWSFRGGKRKRAKRIFFIPFFLYFSHVVIDFFTFDGIMPLGLEVFWPLSSRHFTSPISVFYSVEKDNLSTLFGRHNLLGVALELGIFLPAVLLVAFLRRASVRGGSKLL